MLGQQQWEAVHERHAQGRSVSAIAPDLELDRKTKTVRSCLRQTSWQPYRRAASPASGLDEHLSWLVERAAQVDYSARILWQELRAQRGFTGSYVIVRRAVAPLRSAAQVAALTQRRFETAPGEQTQVDWGHGAAAGRFDEDSDWPSAEWRGNGKPSSSPSAAQAVGDPLNRRTEAGQPTPPPACRLMVQPSRDRLPPPLPDGQRDAVDRWRPWDRQSGSGTSIRASNHPNDLN